MGLGRQIVAQVDTKCNGDVFYELLRFRPNNFSTLAPDHVQGCELLKGEWGAVGSLVSWTFLIDGKQQDIKEVVEAVDEKNKSITYKALEGDLMQIYKSLKAVVHINQNAENCLVTWTIEYEKMSEDIPDPTSIADLAYKMTKAADTLQLQLQ